tara:strand:- start:284 stop:550 length:267 start_codon:yes stop_codon:yes gene_type:complete
MQGMFDRKKPNTEAIKNLKLLITKKYNLPESTILSVAELSCHEPGCPPIETVITARATDKSMRNWKVSKPINEINKIDIDKLFHDTNQ